MKNRLNIFLLIIGVVFLTKFSMAELVTTIQKVDTNKSKPLKVEEGATQIGEETKMRSLKMKLPRGKPKENANMNIGKIEFYVK
jgi:hypothetical protein